MQHAGTKIKCLDLNAIILAIRIYHTVTDWLLLPVPLIIILRLQMLYRKLRLMLVFCVGFFSSFASIIGNVLIQELTSNINGTCKIPGLEIHRIPPINNDCPQMTSTESMPGMLLVSFLQQSCIAPSAERCS